MSTEAMNIKETKTMVVGLGTCGMAAGAQTVYNLLNEQIKEKNLDIALKITGCNGMCHREPIVELIDKDQKRVILGDFTEKKAKLFIDQHILGDKEINAKMVIDANDTESSGGAFLHKQKRIVLRNCGNINPESLEEYVDREGYQALKKVVEKADADWLIEELIASGLRGRGGAGFPAGVKWRLAKQNSGENGKYMICNADEGDPGAFMDRSQLEGDPHAVLEGMTIAAYAIGADVGYIYCRAEYPLALKRLAIAIKQATEAGYLGDNILGSDFSFKIKLKEGAGAFVCGEETALIASIEGKRGMPRIRPPYPAASGLWGKPSNINNVETLANVPWIIRNGAQAYATLGTEESKGTKVFALAGKIKRGGLVEVPMGITIREIVEDVGGGTSSGWPIKAVQIGGPSGGCIPVDLFDTPVDYKEVMKTGAIMGSGGMVVMDNTSCMVDIARYFLQFTQNESCGKCTFCRIGTLRMLETLERICEGKADMTDLDLLEELGQQIKNTSLCGLGQSAPNPVLTTLKYFRDEYVEHIKDKKCRAGRCKSLSTFTITNDCTGCMVCTRNCPTDAITGEKKKLHVIDQDKCIQCGICRDVCKFNAVSSAV